MSAHRLTALPDAKDLRSVCKSISVLDAILCPEWEYRYYSYDPSWDTTEQCLLMKNGSGDQMLVLFHPKGCAINLYSHESAQPDISSLTQDLPEFLRPFFEGEPVKSIGSTACMWKLSEGSWTGSALDSLDAPTAEMLEILDGKPSSYIRYAHEYFAEEFDDHSLSEEHVAQIYHGTPLTREMAESLALGDLNWEDLIGDLDKIGYPHQRSAQQRKPRWKFW